MKATQKLISMSISQDSSGAIIIRGDADDVPLTADLVRSLILLGHKKYSTMHEGWNLEIVSTNSEHIRLESKQKTLRMMERMGL